jgi:hypothetical protein
MAGELQSVWNPQTRLGRAAPKGGPMVLLHAETLDSISVDDVKFAALSMGVLPANIARPVRKVETPPAEEGGEGKPETASGEEAPPAETPPPEAESSPRLAQGSDS